ncbi:MAG: molybdenum cofactor biosynthesis protein MoaE [Gammaproteobacteria bacterium]|nr:molybdenum cofactor biosynthesis protein MoaE [Gammaproteobacteria bacterium]
MQTDDQAEVAIQQADFDVAREYRALCQRSPKAGAVVFFAGIVRDLYEDADDTDTVEYIELRHYEGMTQELCQQIVEEARARYSVDGVRVVHRVGKIYAGEQIVLVAVASRHRNQAFQAAMFIMDYLKTRATLWKKEVGARGEKWVGLKQKDQDAADRW